MNDWQAGSLGDFLTLQRGVDITKASQRPGDVPVISSSGINSFHNEHIALGPGVVIGRKGTLGTCFYVEGPYWPHDTTLWVKDFKQNDARYCYYLLKSMGLEKLDVGAANPTLNRNHAHLLPVLVPPVEIQTRIASILKTYDDLIEVNRRRVAVLEEMARGLFEEWFVRFRFPGHEAVPIHDTPDGPLPEGWRIGPLRTIADLKSGFAFKSEIFVQDGTHSLVTIKHVQDGYLSPPFDSKISTPPLNMPVHCNIGTGDALLSLTGNVGRTCLAWGENLLLNQRVAKIESLLPEFHSFVYIWFRRTETMTRLKQIANGAAQQNLSPIQTMGLNLPMPTRELACRFDKVVRPMLEAVVLHYRTIASLSTQRDLLLPRLVSGQLCVASAERELEDVA